MDGDCNTEDCGVLYIATGEKYIKEAEKSAKSIKETNSLPITLYSDTMYESDVFDECQILDTPNRNEGDSVLSFEELPYPKTLFLDTDTYVCGSLKEIFDSLERFELCCCLNVGFLTKYTELKKYKNLTINEAPEAVYELNTGVIAMKKTNGIKNLLSRWAELYQAQSTETRNQQAFRQAVYESDVRVLTLPRNYNYRLPKVATVEGKIKIIHGRHPCSYERIERCVNETTERRVITKTGWPLGVIPANKSSIRFKLEYNIRQRGLVDTIKKGLNKLI